MIQNAAPFQPRARSWDDVASIAQQDRRWRFGRRLLDVRDARDHLPGSVSIPVPTAADWPDRLRSHLLGDRARELVILAETPGRARDAADHLSERGWRADFLEHEVTSTALMPGAAPGELWRPDPFLVELLPLLPPPSAGAVLDLGAGSGRDSCFLATMGYNCLLVDRYQDALDLALDRARRMGVSIRTRLQDLSDPEPVPGRYACVLNIRFLERAQLSRLESMLRRGGAMILHTFAPSPLAREHGHTRERFRIGEDEFRGWFPPPGWEFLRGPEEVDQGGDRWIQGMVRRVG